MAKKKRRPAPASSPAIPRRLLAELTEADRLISHGRAGAALEILRSLDQAYPNREEVLSELLNAYHQLKDFQEYLPVCERLVRLRPNDSELAIVLAGAYMLNMAPARALRAFRRFLERWPDHPRAAEARKTVAELEPGLLRDLAEEGFTGEEGVDLAAMHEEARALLQQGRFSQARRVEEEILRRRPHFAPALNNISLTYRVEDNLAAAIATTERVLTFDPGNLHALGNLVQYFSVSGRLDAAREWAQRLQTVESTNPDAWTKKAEALTYLGDDQGVLDAFDAAERRDEKGLPHDEALLYHLGAVAALRLGDEAHARQRWQRALKLYPSMDLPQENLADLRQPVGQRHTPWPFSFRQWVPQGALRELATQVSAASRRGREEAITRAVQRYLKQHPEFTALIPILLDRGDPEGRTFALQFAVLAETPETLAALRDFAVGQRGPDAMRMEAMRAATRAGLLPSGAVRMWVEGEWREIMSLDFDIHSEVLYQHPPQVEEWLAEATLALRGGDGKRAEELIRQAMEVEPDAPDAVNNMAAAYELQGRLPEAEALAVQNFERHPDYLFGRTSMAQFYLRDGKIKEAEALLEPLLSRRRFHHLEFAAFCAAQVELLLAKGNRDAARSWLEMWASIDSDNPMLADLRQRVERPGGGRRLWGGRG